MDVKAKLKQMGRGPNASTGPSSGAGGGAKKAAPILPPPPQPKAATNPASSASTSDVKAANTAKKKAPLHPARSYSHLLAAAEIEKKEEKKQKQMDALNEVRQLRERIDFQQTGDAPPKWQRIKFHRRARDPTEHFKRPLAGSPTKVFLEHLKKVDEQAERRFRGEEQDEKAIAAFTKKRDPLLGEEEGEEEEGWGADPSVGVSTKQKKTISISMRTAMSVLREEEEPEDPSFDVKRGFYSRTQPQRGPIIVNDPFRPTVLPKPGTRGRNFTQSLTKTINENGGLPPPASPALSSSALTPAWKQRPDSRGQSLASIPSGTTDSSFEAHGAPRVSQEEAERIAKKRLLQALGSEALVLARIGFTELPSALRSTLLQCLGSIKELSISNNRIKRLERDFFVRWRSLHRLLISGNLLSYMHEEIGSLKYLTELDVSNNRLVTLPVAIGTLPLRVLSADGNSLTRLPPFTSHTLEVLKVRQNALGYLPYGLNKCGKMTHIDASYNGIAALYIIPAVEVEDDPELQLNPAVYAKTKNPENGKDMWVHRVTREIMKVDPAIRLQRAIEAHEDAVRRMDRRLRGEGGEDSDDDEEEKEEWVELIDPITAAPYYKNMRTGETSWEDKRGQKSSMSEDPAVNLKTKIQQQIQSLNEANSKKQPVKKWKPPPPPGPPPDSEDEKREVNGGEEDSGGAPFTPVKSEAGALELKKQLRLDLSPIYRARGEVAPPSPILDSRSAASKDPSASVASEATPAGGPASTAASQTETKKKKRQKIRLAPSIIARQRLRALKALGMSDWEMIVDPVTGEVRFRHNLTMKETETPPPHIDTIGELQFLRTLVLSHNKLSVIPDSLGQIFRLEELRLDNNILTEDSFPPSFSKLRLQTLNLAHNRMRDIPHSITRMDTLRVLNLDSNKVSKHPAMATPTSSALITALLLPLTAHAHPEAHQPPTPPTCFAGAR